MATVPVIDGAVVVTRKVASSNPPATIPPTTSPAIPPPSSPAPPVAVTSPPAVIPPPPPPPAQAPPPNVTPTFVAAPPQTTPPAPPTSGGGAPGTPVVTQLNTTDTGGLGQSAAGWFFMLPVLTPYYPSALPQHVIAIYDSNDFNDPIDVMYYQFRVEDIAINRVPTVRRVILCYRDLGVVTIGVFLRGSNDNGQSVGVQTVAVLGNATPTFQILTKFIDLELTAFRPQLAITRPSYAGPLSLIQVTIIGQTEEVTL